MDKREVGENEEAMFRHYIRDIKHEHHGTELSYFEMNLEVTMSYLNPLSGSMLRWALLHNFTLSNAR